MIARHPDAALLALQDEVDAINAVCMALSVRRRAARALDAAGEPCPTLRGEEAAHEAAALVWSDLHDRVAGMRARTLDGMRFKARFGPTPWLDPVMMRSIVEDLCERVPPNVSKTCAQCDTAGRCDEASPECRESSEEAQTSKAS